VTTECVWAKAADGSWAIHYGDDLWVSVAKHGKQWMYYCAEIGIPDWSPEPLDADSADEAKALALATIEVRARHLANAAAALRRMAKDEP